MILSHAYCNDTACGGMFPCLGFSRRNMMFWKLLNWLSLLLGSIKKRASSKLRSVEH